MRLITRKKISPTRVRLNYISTILTPKYRPYEPDVLTGDPNEASDDVKSINQTVTFSTSFDKTIRSKNWILRNTLDRITLDYSKIIKHILQ